MVVKVNEQNTDDTCWTSDHLRWLKDTGERPSTANGKVVEVWEFRYEMDEAVLSAWSKHFRNHYCLDAEIDYYRRGYKFTRSEYLNRIKFPDPVPCKNLIQNVLLQKPENSFVSIGRIGPSLSTELIVRWLGSSSTIFSQPFYRSSTSQAYPTRKKIWKS